MLIETVNHRLKPVAIDVRYFNPKHKVTDESLQGLELINRINCLRPACRCACVIRVAGRL